MSVSIKVYSIPSLNVKKNESMISALIMQFLTTFDPLKNPGGTKVITYQDSFCVPGQKIRLALLSHLE